MLKKPIKEDDVKLNYFMFITGILQFAAGALEMIRGNITLGLVYAAYGFSACALSTI